tara:strand:- start:2623 stop:2853 length:231 start_codon:yes stop_codon:yes gene_type:complete
MEHPDDMGRYATSVKWRNRMLKLLILLIVIALVAGALGFSGIAAGAAFFAKVIFAIMLIGIAILVGMVLLGIAAFN